MQVDHLASLTVNAPQDGYSTNEQQAALAAADRERIATLPGVQSVATSSSRRSSAATRCGFRVEGRPYHGEHNEVQYREVSQGYFSTLRRASYADATSPTTISREATRHDHQPGAGAADFPAEDPIGKQFGTRRPRLSPRSDRRHRRRHQGRAAGRGDAADDVRGVCAGPHKRLCRLRTHLAGGAVTASSHGGRHQSARPATVDISRHDDVVDHQRLRGGVPPSIGGGARRGIRGGGVGARGRRPVRRRCGTG